MLENNMVINATAHDLQCQPYAHVCDICDDGVNEVTVFANGDKVCEECKKDYLKDNSRDFIAPYIDSCAYEFYVRWVFMNLPLEQKTAIAKAYFEKMKECESMMNACGYPMPVGGSPSAEEVEFCTDNFEFLDFVEEELGGKQA